LAATRDLMLTTGQRCATERVASFLLAFSRRSVDFDKRCHGCLR
jgi:hypothetical protein